MFIHLLYFICVILSASASSHSIFIVFLPRIDPTINTVYDEVVANAQLIILPVANMDGTIEYLNASAVKFVVFVELSEKHSL